MENKILEVLPIIEMKNGTVGLVFWDGQYKVYFHPAQMEQMLIQ